MHATVDGFTYHNVSRRYYIWRNKDGTWDAVETFKRIEFPGKVEGVVPAPGSESTPTPVPQASYVGGVEMLRFTSISYPDFESPLSRDESRFVCSLALTPSSSPASLQHTPPTVQSIVSLLTTHAFSINALPDSTLACLARVWSHPMEHGGIGDVGEMRWVLNVVRMLVSGVLLKGVESDTLLAGFELSPYRFEIRGLHACCILARLDISISVQCLNYITSYNACTRGLGPEGIIWSIQC